MQQTILGYNSGMEFSRNTLFKCFLLCAVLFSLQIIPRWWSDSMIMDEEWNLTASYYYWKCGDVLLAHGTTAPGALNAVPLLFMDLKFQPITNTDWRLRSLCFIFKDNLQHLETLTALSRSVDWILGLLIGFFLFQAVQSGPLSWGVSALFLWAFEPTLLSFSGTAKTDISVAFWFLLSVLYYKRIQSQGRSLTFGLVGILAGLTAAARYNGLLIIPVILVLDVFYCLDSGSGLRALTRRLHLWLAGLAGFVVSISLVYQQGYFHSANHVWPLTLYYLNLRAYTDLRPDIANQMIFFAGRYWPGGSYFSFPYHFFFKNTLPFFMLLTAGTLLGLSKKGFLPRWVWVPPLVYLGFFYLADKSMNIRHALPAYPFLILIAAKAFQWFWQACRRSSRAWTRYLVVALLLWHAAGVLFNFPYHIAYANELMSPKDKPACLYSFNWNLGQDMKRLTLIAQARGWKRVKLLTGQRTDPYFYGMPWESWTERDFVEPQPGTVYVLDPSIVFDRPEYQKLVVGNKSWLLKKRMSGNVGGTLCFYEIPGPWDFVPKGESPTVNSFPYYAGGIPPYRRTTPIDTWIEP